MVGHGREDVEDASAHRELAAPRDHVDPQIGELHEAARDRLEVVAAARDGEVEHAGVGEPGRHRLQGAAHGCGDDEGRVTGIRPQRGFAEHREATTDGLGRGAQPLMRQCLPRRKVTHGGVRHEALQGSADALGASPGRGDDQKGRRRTAGARPPTLGEQRRQHRRVESRHHREVGVDARGLDGALHGRSLRQGARDPGNCHRSSLFRPTDTGLGRGRSPALGRRWTLPRTVGTA